jgi:hypothetical protein
MGLGWFGACVRRGTAGERPVVGFGRSATEQSARAATGHGQPLHHAHAHAHAHAAMLRSKSTRSRSIGHKERHKEPDDGIIIAKQCQSQPVDRSSSVAKRARHAGRRSSMQWHAWEMYYHWSESSIN